MNEPSLEQRILEAAARWGHDFFLPSDIKALLEEKNAEIERLKKGLIQSGDWKFLGKSPQELTALIAREAQRETTWDEWKRIAGQYRETLESIASWGDCILRPDDLNGVELEAFSLGSSKAFEQQAKMATDALTGKGEPK
jgi:hypothetical protein